jgi:hypothetical protein
MPDNAFSALLNPDKQGTITGFLGGMLGKPTESQYQGSAIGTAAKSISDLQAQGLSPQQAVMKFMQTPEGMDFFTANGSNSMDQLAKLISNTTPPDPKAIGLKPGETGMISQGGKPLTGVMSVPTSDVQSFNQFMTIAGANPQRIRELADLQMDPTAKNTTAKERAIDSMVSTGAIDAATGDKLKAGTYQVIPATDNFGNTTGDVSIIDISDPKNVKNVLIRAGQGGNTPAPSPGTNPPAVTNVPPSGPGVTPDKGAGAGVLPPTSGSSAFDPDAAKYFGNKANMFLGAGVVPNLLGAASKVSETIDPSLIIPQGATANDRKTLLDQTNNAITAMGAEAGGFGINKATLKTFQALVPSADVTSSPHAEIQKGIRLLQKVQEEITAEEGIIKNGDVPQQEKVAAAKRIEGWRRVERTLPSMDEMASMEKAIRNGTAGADTIASGVNTAIGAGKKAVTSATKQVDEVAGPNFEKMDAATLQTIDPRKLSDGDKVRFRNRIQALIAEKNRGRQQSGNSPQ